MNMAASATELMKKAELRACGATNLPEHEYWITHHSSGIRVPFGLTPIKLGDSS